MTCPSSLMGHRCGKPPLHAGRCSSKAGSWDRDPEWTPDTEPQPAPDLPGQGVLDLVLP